MKTLLEDYKRRLKTAMEEIKKGDNDITLTIHATAASCYRKIISELEHQLKEEKESPGSDYFDQLEGQ